MNTKTGDLDTITIHKPSARLDHRWQKYLTQASLILLGAGLAIVGGYIAAGPDETVANVLELTPVSNITTESAVPAPTIENTIRDPNFVSQVIELAGPAVVRIDATRTAQLQDPTRFNDPLFDRFFGSPVPMPSRERARQGVGSGFIFDDNGHILTNAHVVEGASTVEITLKDGRSFEGTVLGVDSLTDVAVVRVEASDLPIVELSDSDQIVPGQWAIAIGNPLGLDNTVTAGIVSATGRYSRDVGVPDKRVEFIQTDTAINPGNSGGPLLNEYGEVIGMNTAIIQGAQGIGFSVPINTAKAIADQIIETGRASHPYLGIRMVTLTPEVTQDINNNPDLDLTVTATEGVLVIEVLPNSPAAAAGLMPGDVIQAINDTPVDTADTLQRLVAASRLGDPLQLDGMRNGQTLAVEATTEALDQSLN